MSTPFRLSGGFETGDGYVLDIVPTSDGKHAAAPCTDGGIHVIDMETLQRVIRLPISGFNITEVHYPHGGDGSLIWCSTLEGDVGLMDLRSGQVGLTTKGPAPILSFSLNCANTVVAAGTELIEQKGEEENEARILFWDVRSAMNPIAQFTDSHSDDITQVRFHPNDANALITGSTDGLVNLFNLTTIEEDDALYQVIKADSIHKIGYFGPSYEYIYYQTHIETFGLYKFENADLIKLYGDVRSCSTGEHEIEYLIDSLYEPQEQRLYLFSGSKGGNLGILNVSLNSMELVHTLNGGHSEIIRGVHWNPYTRRLASGGQDGKIVFWTN
ncbi:WD repeat-containing protein 89 [Blyttiomyces sp. JEL0837]|nr:WD repeat-containing protein 89 [Blyttiomyces sp. JEL0837]